VGLTRFRVHRGLGLALVLSGVLPGVLPGVVGGVAGLGEVELVAAPEQVLALGGPAGIGVIRRADPAMGRREPVLVGLPPDDHLPAPGVGVDVVVLDQHGG